MANNFQYQNKDWYYYVKPTWIPTAMKAWCDMTTAWWGRTRWYKTTSQVTNRSYANNCIDNWYHEADTYFCIKPTSFWSTEYMVTRWTNKAYFNSHPNQWRNISSAWTRSWWEFTPYTSCWEYNINWTNDNKWRYNWGRWYWVKDFDCYVR